MVYKHVLRCCIALNVSFFLNSYILAPQKSPTLAVGWGDTELVSGRVDVSPETVLISGKITFHIPLNNQHSTTIINMKHKSRTFSAKGVKIYINNQMKLKKKSNQIKSTNLLSCFTTLKTKARFSIQPLTERPPLFATDFRSIFTQANIACTQYIHAYTYMLHVYSIFYCRFEDQKRTRGNATFLQVTAIPDLSLEWWEETMHIQPNQCQIPFLLFRTSLSNLFSF